VVSYDDPLFVDLENPTLEVSEHYGVYEGSIQEEIVFRA
jgi:hypothetical protein